MVTRPRKETTYESGDDTTLTVILLTQRHMTKSLTECEEV